MEDGVDRQSDPIKVKAIAQTEDNHAQSGANQSSERDALDECPVIVWFMP
jgi:hypothetical protein